MEIAGHNIQKRLVDVNNLWQWPLQVYSPGWTTNVQITPAPSWQWTRCADSIGYLVTDDTAPFRNIADHSVEVTNGARYFACTFIDLPEPGHYCLTFNASDEGEAKVVMYIELDNGKWEYAHVDEYIIVKGENKKRFSCEAGQHIRLDFASVFNSGKWITISDVRIREGDV